MRISVLVPVLAALPIFAQDSVPYVPAAIYAVHSATRRTAEFPETALAPGSLCDITTRGLYQPPGELLQGDTVTLRFRAPGASSASDLRILAGKPDSFEFTVQVRADSPTGQAEILAVTASGRSFSTKVWIAASGFGVFTRLLQGYDAAAAQVWRDGLRAVGLTTPVRAGEWVTLWGTGLGKGTPVVDVAGVRVVPAYAGAAPEMPGVDQINFQFPAGVPEDCYLPLTVKVDGSSVQTTSIAAFNGTGTCRHRLGLSAAALSALDQGEMVPLSQSWVHSDVLPNFEQDDTYRRYDTVTLDFMQHDAARIQFLTGLLTTPAAGCQLSLGVGIGGTVFMNVPPLDSGTPTLIGPGGVNIAMEGSSGHFSTPVPDVSYPFDRIPPSSFGPGEWTVSTPGGRDIAPFQAALRIPPPLLWTNRATVSPVSRASDLVLNWDAKGYTEKEWMQGSIAAGTGWIQCQAPATAGSITIPASLLARLPESTGPKSLVQLLLTPLQGNPVLYPVPLVGGGSFVGVATFSYLEAVAVELQ